MWKVAIASLSVRRWQQCSQPLPRSADPCLDRFFADPEEIADRRLRPTIERAQNQRLLQVGRQGSEGSHREVEGGSICQECFGPGASSAIEAAMSGVNGSAIEKN